VTIFLNETAASGWGSRFLAPRLILTTSLTDWWTANYCKSFLLSIRINGSDGTNGINTLQEIKTRFAALRCLCCFREKKLWKGQFLVTSLDFASEKNTWNWHQTLQRLHNDWQHDDSIKGSSMKCKNSFQNLGSARAAMLGWSHPSTLCRPHHNCENWEKVYNIKYKSTKS